jgi:hypothetical protein
MGAGAAITAAGGKVAMENDRPGRPDARPVQGPAAYVITSSKVDGGPADHGNLASCLAQISLQR